MDAAPRRPYRIGTWLGRLLFSVLLFAGTCEALVRYQKPTPKFQIVRSLPGRVQLYTVQGAPAWIDPRYPKQTNEACAVAHPNRPVTLFYGSSITWGSGVERDEAFTHLLAQRYGDRRCVMNLASTGSSMQTKAARLFETAPNYPGAQLVVEIWDNDPNDYSALAGSAYNLRDIATDAQGFPATFPVPAPLNGWLFRTSVAYEYAVLAFSEPVHISTSERWGGRVLPRLDAIKALADAQGSTLTLLFMPALAHTPLPRVEDRKGYRMVAAWADEHGVPWIDNGALLARQSAEDIRYDACCHLNARGHALTAQRIYPLLDHATTPQTP